ncbi:uncharacterized protein lrif1 isoform X2 [Gouania willdenowi]|uniref:uncharacterized protein lrif1 isoform X2 n=1 Tax=Gouania willdenowi TaxID=441366 RepID=UPI001054A23D|nr:ligand-dependent nuclear receptor-interacting factor 1 isoform X2 [Gouania willdenowi]
MDAAQRGSGVFYQAMPFTGVDGKKIMKLIPVQKVNGHFFQAPIQKPQKYPTTQKSVPVNTFKAPVKEVLNAALASSLSDQSSLMPQHELPLLATQITNCGTLQNNSHLLLKSPALPRGQYLQIPPNAQVRTVPASELPSRIKKQIFNSQANSSASSSLQSVVYVSPVTTVIQNATSGESALNPLQLFTKTTKPNSERPLPEGVKSNLKLVPKDSHRPNSPTRWVVEEVDHSATLNSTDIHQDSLSGTSKSFQALAGMANVNKQWKVCANADQSIKEGSVQGLDSPMRWVIEKVDSSAVLNLKPPDPRSDISKLLQNVASQEHVSCRCEDDKKAVSDSIQKNCVQDQSNALVMCNGKVFFVGKKFHLASNTNATNSTEVSQMTTTSQCLQPFESETAHTMQEVRITTVPNEVIDLCDDDDAPQDRVATKTSLVSYLDEDSVIFVSYSPPKSLTCSPQMPIAQNQVITLNSESQSDSTSCSGPDISTPRVEPGHISHIESNPSIGDATNERSNRKSQQGSDNQQISRMGADVQSGKPAVLSSSSGGEQLNNKTENVTNPGNVPTPTLPPLSPELTPRLLKQLFQIKADVKICLQRIDERTSHSLPAQHSLTQFSVTSECHFEPKTGQMMKLPHSVEPGRLPNVKKMAFPIKQNLSTTRPSEIPFWKGSHSGQNINPLSASTQKCHPGRISCDGTQYHTETGILIGCPEPLHQDFLGADEIVQVRSEKPHALPQTEMSLSPRRMVRTRKRTMCLCCSHFTQDPAKKGALFPEKKCKKKQENKNCSER